MLRLLSAEALMGQNNHTKAMSFLQAALQGCGVANDDDASVLRLKLRALQVRADHV